MDNHFLMRWARQDSNLRPSGYEPRALPLSYGPGWAKKIITWKRIRGFTSIISGCTRFLLSVSI